MPVLGCMGNWFHRELLKMNLKNGILFVNSQIHWEKLCGQRAKCSIHLEVIVDRPPQVFPVDVEVHALIKILWSLEQEKQVNLFLNLDC